MRFYQVIKRVVILGFLILAIGSGAASAEASHLMGPVPPTNVQATDGTYPDYIRVTWNTVSGAASYAIYRDEEGGVNPWYVATTTTNSYKDYGVGADYKYDYRIRACSTIYGTDCGGYSWPVGRGWLDAGTPTNVQATDGAYTSKVRVTWLASANATSYKVYRGTSDSGYSTATMVGGALYWDEGNITPGVKYYWWVRGYNSHTGDYSSFSSDDTGYRSLSAPTGFSASDGIYCTYTRMLWDYVQGASSYTVTRGDSPASHNVTWQGINTLYWNDYTGVASRPYYYWVRACCADTGCGPSTMYDSGYRGAPPAPAGIMATDGTIADRVNIHWGAVRGAIYYEIYRGASPSFVGLLNGNVPSSSYDDYSAVPGTVYYYKVKACGGCGCGATGPVDSGSRPAAQPTSTPTPSRTPTRTLTPSPTTTSDPRQTATPTWTPSEWLSLPLVLR